MAVSSTVRAEGLPTFGFVMGGLIRLEAVTGEWAMGDVGFMSLS